MLDVTSHGFTTVTAATGVGNYEVTPTAADASNYTFKYVPGTLTIAPAPLTIKANDATRQRGADNAVLTSTYMGFKNGDTSAVVSNLFYNTPATPSSGTGTYLVTPYGAKAANYSISYQPGSLTITEPVQVVTTTTTVTGTTGVVGSWSDGRLQETLTQAQLDGLAIMNAHISPALDFINTTKGEVMAEAVQMMVVEKFYGNYTTPSVTAAKNVIYRLLAIMRDYGMTPDVTNYADFVHSCMPAWLSTMQDLAKNDPSLASLLATVGYDSMAWSIASGQIAYTFRTPDEKAMTAAVTNYMAARMKEVDARMASLEQQLKAQVMAEDPSVARQRLDVLWGSGHPDVASHDSKGVMFETNTTVTQKWAEYYALKMEKTGYLEAQGQSGSSDGKPVVTAYVLKQLLDQGKIQIF